MRRQEESSINELGELHSGKQGPRGASSRTTFASVLGQAVNRRSCGRCYEAKDCEPRLCGNRVYRTVARIAQTPQQGRCRVEALGRASCNAILTLQLKHDLLHTVEVRRRGTLEQRKTCSSCIGKRIHTKRTRSNGGSGLCWSCQDDERVL